jgi:hypothetical protein
VAPLDDAIATFNSTEHRSGKTVISVRNDPPAKADATQNLASVGS